MNQLIRLIYVSACQRQFVGCAGILKKERFVTIVIPPANFVCGGYTVFTLSVRVCVRLQRFVSLIS